MIRLADLHASVHAALAGKRLGTPVFVRYLIARDEKAGVVTARLAQVTAAVRDWFHQPLESLYAIGQVKNRAVSLMLEFRGGGTALVGWSAGQGRGDGIDLLVIGNHGTLCHDAGTAVLWDEPAGTVAGKPDGALVDWIERALRSGRPETANP